MWVHGILDKHWSRINRQSQGKGAAIQQGIAETFTGLGITTEDVRDVELSLKLDLVHATIEDLVPLCAEIVKISKPMLIVGNKFDETPEALCTKLAAQKVAFASAASELALRNAAAANVSEDTCRAIRSFDCERGGAFGSAERRPCKDRGGNEAEQWHRRSAGDQPCGL